MNPLRIAILLDDFYPSSGGTGRSVQTQIDELVSQGHSVTLIAPRYFLEKPTNCQTIALPTFYLPGAPIYTGILYRTKGIVRRISQAHKFDIVHSQSERGALPLAALIAKDQKIPHVHTFHANLSGTHAELPILSLLGTLAYIAAIVPPLMKISQRRTKGKAALSANSKTPFVERLDWNSFAKIASHVDAFSVPANFMIDQMSQCLPELKDRGRVIPTGISKRFSDAILANKRSVSDNKIRFLSVCRLSKEKRVEDIVRAFLLADIPNSQLDIVGTGDRQGKIRKLASNSSNIVFHDHVGDINHLASIYLNADVFIIASYRFDTQGITIGEATAAGLPVIYCDDRLSFGIGPENSILTNSPEAEDIAKAMKEISDTKLRQQLSEGSKQIAPNLSPEKMANQYVSLYKSAILSYKGR